MAEHANDLIPFLLWLIVAVGSALLGLVVWIGKRLHDNVDSLPALIAEKVKAVHDEILQSIKELRTTQKKLEEDMRSHVANLDRRVLALEVRDEVKRSVRFTDSP